MPTYHVQQTWRAKGSKTVVSNDLENPPQPPKNEFAEGCSKSNSILKLGHFWKPRVLSEYQEKEKTMLFKVNLEGHLMIGSNISRSSSHTTLWFLQVKHQPLKTNLQGLLIHLHILIFSKSNLELQVFGLSSRFVRTLIINISSSERPANTTSIHRARNSGRLVVLFHPSPKHITKRCQSRGNALKITKWRRKRRTKFYWRTCCKMPLC